MDRVKVKIPATSANIGSGFDSIGLALGMYNYVTAELKGSGLDINILDESGKFLAKDERNLVYRAMKSVFEKTGRKLGGVKLTLQNNIPVTRGLGSSSAGIVGGLIAANTLCGNALGEKELVNIAAHIEGHPDNVAPALLGGFTVSVMTKYDVKYVRNKLPDDLRFAALVPSFFLQTKKARSVLPKYVSHRDAVFNVGRGALLAASIISGKYENIRTAVGDKLHQKYRRRLIPFMDDIFSSCYQSGALGVYLSGAGPTIISIIKADNTAFNTKLAKAAGGKLKNWELHILEPDNRGAAVIKT